MNIEVSISVGELFDKITILRIKQKKFTDTQKLENVKHELAVLEKQITFDTSDINNLISQLEDINTVLWDIENGKRECEALQQFDDRFISLARDVYIKNDERARLKKEINLATNSDIIEEKEHTEYDRSAVL